MHVTEEWFHGKCDRQVWFNHVHHFDIRKNIDYRPRWPVWTNNWTRATEYFSLEIRPSSLEIIPFLSYTRERSITAESRPRWLEVSHFSNPFFVKWVSMSAYMLGSGESLLFPSFSSIKVSIILFTGEKKYYFLENVEMDTLFELICHYMKVRRFRQRSLSNLSNWDAADHSQLLCIIATSMSAANASFESTVSIISNYRNISRYGFHNEKEWIHTYSDGSHRQRRRKRLRRCCRRWVYFFGYLRISKLISMN